ncbi:MAG: methyltransferase, partial [Flavicella sp.]
MSARTVNTPFKSSSFKTYVSCKDYLVSDEKFDLLLDDNLDLLITNPKPVEKDLGRYYESEEYISHTDGKKSLIDVVYQEVRNYTLKKKLNLINSFQTD